jgi:hypothetical protein
MVRVAILFVLYSHAVVPQGCWYPRRRVVVGLRHNYAVCSPPPPPSSSLTLKTVVAVAASLVIKVDGRFPKQAHLIINHIAFILGLDEDRKVISWVSHSAVCALLLSVAFPDLRSNSLSFSNQVAHHWGNPNPKMLLLGSCLESGHGQD